MIEERKQYTIKSTYIHRGRDRKTLGNLFVFPYDNLLPIRLRHFHIIRKQENLDDNKGVITSFKSKKDGQYNGQENKTKS